MKDNAPKKQKTKGLMLRRKELRDSMDVSSNEMILLLMLSLWYYNTPIVDWQTRVFSDRMIYDSLEYLLYVLEAGDNLIEKAPGVGPTIPSFQMKLIGPAWLPYSLCGALQYHTLVTTVVVLQFWTLPLEMSLGSALKASSFLPCLGALWFSVANSTASCIVFGLDASHSYVSCREDLRLTSQSYQVYLGIISPDNIKLTPESVEYNLPSNTMKGASSKLNLVLDCTVIDIEDQLLYSQTIEVSTNNPLVPLKFMGLELRKVSLARGAANDQAMPSVNQCLKLALVIGYVVVVYWAGDALVVSFHWLPIYLQII
ncbi:hypothetical protein Tco_0800290 [Tanacetum coccineum]|uniref:Uncharacterized protein n=1 Tax=Tanacetum coccineum TaxID=301880 RepID=A0ABQ4ZVZ8_9ASTR